MEEFDYEGEEDLYSKRGCLNRETWTRARITTILAIIGAVLLVITAVVIVLVYGIPKNKPDETEEYWETISIIAITQHLSELQTIANQNGGTRSVSSPGYNASLAYIKSQIESATSLVVSQQYFSINITRQLADPIFCMVTPAQINYTESIDYKAFSYSGSGDVTAAVQWIPQLGCEIDDFSSFTAGNIALISRGNCSFNIKATNAIEKGAVGVLIYNYAEENEAIQGNLGEPIPVPAFSLTYALGQQLRNMESTVYMFYSSEVDLVFTSNLIAETPTGNDDSVIVIGSHLDSVDAGPGINDNGSGSSANLQMALQSPLLDNKNKIRFIWFSAEEEGLLGSNYYVSQLSQTDKQKIALNLNFDMLGSPNYIRGILNGTQAPQEIQPAATVISNLFETYYISQNLTYVFIPFNGRSDYGPFLEANIPAGGIETGAEVIKDEALRSKFGGLANTPFDPCYHQACDTVDNINNEVLLQMSQAAAFALSTFATQANLSEYLNTLVH